MSVSAKTPSLAGALLLSGAAIKYDGAGQVVFLQNGFQCDGGSQTACAQSVVTAAVTGCTGYDGLLYGAGIFLAHVGQCIKFAQKADDGLAAAKAAFEGGGDTGQTGLNGKAVFVQCVDQCLGRFLL